jgi:hypothetical protein
MTVKHWCGERWTATTQSFTDDEVNDLSLQYSFLYVFHNPFMVDVKIFGLLRITGSYQGCKSIQSSRYHTWPTQMIHKHPECVMTSPWQTGRGQKYQKTITDASETNINHKSITESIAIPCLMNWIMFQWLIHTPSNWRSKQLFP